MGEEKISRGTSRTTDGSGRTRLDSACFHISSAWLTNDRTRFQIHLCSHSSQEIQQHDAVTTDNDDDLEHDSIDAKIDLLPDVLHRQLNIDLQPTDDWSPKPRLSVEEEKDSFIVLDYFSFAHFVFSLSLLYNRYTHLNVEKDTHTRSRAAFFAPMSPLIFWSTDEFSYWSCHIGYHHSACQLLIWQNHRDCLLGKLLFQLHLGVCLTHSIFVIIPRGW